MQIFSQQAKYQILQEIKQQEWKATVTSALVKGKKLE